MQRRGGSVNDMTQNLDTLEYPGLGRWVKHQREVYYVEMWRRQHPNVKGYRMTGGAVLPISMNVVAKPPLKTGNRILDNI